MKTLPGALVLLVLVGGCSSVPEGAYLPGLSQPATVAVAQSLYRVAQAADDDPARYSFGLIKTDEATAYSTEDATFYFSDGLARLPIRIVEPIVAHEVAHEVLRHSGVRRNLSLSISAGFTVLGVVFPGAGFIGFFVNPLVVRAFNREQELSADAKGVEILRSMGYEAPRRVLASALTAVDRANGSPQEDPLLATEPPLAARLKALGPLEPSVQLAASTDGILAR